MKKETFFEVLGELEDDLVNEADEAIVSGNKKWNEIGNGKGKENPKAWGVLAACAALLIVGLFLAIRSFQIRQENENMAESRTADAAPMVYVGDTLYQQSSDQQGYPDYKEEFHYLGTITSDVTKEQNGESDGIPKENFQANDPIVGCEVYQYGENIVVKINGSYWLYIPYGEQEVNWESLSELEKEQLDPSYQK